MTDILARAFQVNHLSLDRLAKLHDYENREAYVFSAAEIRLRARPQLPEHGAIDEERLSRLEKAVWAIYHEVRRDEIAMDAAIDDMDESGRLVIVHAFDRKILISNLDFSVLHKKRGDGSMQRLHKAMNTASDDPSPF